MTWFMDNNTRTARPTQHRVLMNFMSRNGWQISFLEEDCRTTLPLKLTFATPDKILEIHQRWGDRSKGNTEEELQRDIQMGRPGSVWLMLTPEQYATLYRRT